MTRLEAVSDPVRLRIIRHLERTPDASLQELADVAGVHLNTVRPHVAELEERGALLRASAPPSGRGRPPLRYSLAPDWALPTSDFRGLAEVLAAALIRRASTPEEIRVVGLEWGRYLLGRPGEHDIEEELIRALELLGFSARIEGQSLELSACPCALVLPDKPELICELAVAVVDGLLAGSGSDLQLTERFHDPAARACGAVVAARANGRAAGAGRMRVTRLNPLKRRTGDNDQ